VHCTRAALHGVCLKFADVARLQRWLFPAFYHKTFLMLVLLLCLLLQWGVQRHSLQNAAQVSAGDGLCGRKRGRGCVAQQDLVQAWEILGVVELIRTRAPAHYCCRLHYFCMNIQLALGAWNPKPLRCHSLTILQYSL
jgi:hypothetical protein